MTATALLQNKHPLRRVLALGGVLALALAGVFTLLTAASPESASAAPIDQCNGVGNGGGQTLTCRVQIINTWTGDPATSFASVSINNGAFVLQPEVVTEVTQCNAAVNGGGSVLTCDIEITNNIAMNAPGAPFAASVNQCQANQPDGLGTAPSTCDPNQSTSGATITQCNGTGNSGGLVPGSGCTASGTVSASLPITVNQCNASANEGGGNEVHCSVSITTNVVDTGLGGGDTGGGDTTPGGGGTPTGGGTGFPPGLFPPGQGFPPGVGPPPVVTDTPGLAG